MLKKPKIVGIAGGSCSGKSSIAVCLAESLPGQVLVVGLDSYYHDFMGVSESNIEVDVPDALDRTLLFKQTEILAAGEAVQKPVYDYATHSRKSGGEWVVPGQYIIIEGLFTLYWARIRDFMALSVFVTTDHETALARRIDRDVRERGRTEQSVRDQYREKVQPNFDRYVLPTKNYAQLVVDGLEPAAACARKIQDTLKKMPD